MKLRLLQNYKSSHNHTQTKQNMSKIKWTKIKYKDEY